MKELFPQENLTLPELLTPDFRMEVLSLRKSELLTPYQNF